MAFQGEFEWIDLVHTSPVSGTQTPYASARRRLTQHLIQYTLTESYHKFCRFKIPYPFVPLASLRPGAMGTTKEYKLHNNALIIMMDGEIPERMRKYFRCRTNNQVNKKNIASLAPGLHALKDYDHAYRLINHDRFGFLLRTLLPLDFSLLIQKTKNSERNKYEFQLTHFHVKIERLTDTALRSLGIQLNYLKKSLYERGEDFVDDLEKKFFEYFNFYHNAAGRRSAAALAAQVIAREKKTGTVFITSQQDRRMTLLSSLSHMGDVSIEQYLLYILSSKELSMLEDWANKRSIDFSSEYLVDKIDGKGIVVLGVYYEHTQAALPSTHGNLKQNINLREKWVRISEKMIMPVHENFNLAIRYPILI
ncbi:MAG: hypothetical protein HQL63_11810 [Magnetococcales bacterium]|nr:hypothetical protein [Magnetococcales bacterium]MBF0321443.1 hypothetical protein [Magnetococcales bacterium]